MLGQATGNLDSLDSPRPGLGGSHHLPPYSIICVAPWHPHPNGFYSQDSQGGISKLSWFGLLGLWEFITPDSDLGLGWGLKQTCSSPQELSKLSNGVSHSICAHQGRVDSRLFVIGSQTASLTPGLSFDHNLCCRCPNGSCKAIFDIYTSRPFQRYKEHLKARGVLTSAIELWSCGSPGGLQVLTFGNVSLIFTLAPKWGYDRPCGRFNWKFFG